MRFRPAMAAAGSEELYTTDNRTTADGLAGLPRDYTGVPAARAAAARRSRPADPRRAESWPARADAGGRAAPGVEPGGAAPRCRRSKRRAPAACSLDRDPRRSRRAGASRRPRARRRPTSPASASRRQPAHADGAGSPARLPQCGRRSPHRRARSRRRAGVALHPAGRRRDLRPRSSPASAPTCPARSPRR